MPSYQDRNISRLTRDTYALILAGGRGSRLHELTDWRAKPATFLITDKRAWPGSSKSLAQGLTFVIGPNRGRTGWRTRRAP